MYVTYTIFLLHWELNELMFPYFFEFPLLSNQMVLHCVRFQAGSEISSNINIYAQDYDKDNIDFVGSVPIMILRFQIIISRL